MQQNDYDSSAAFDSEVEVRDPAPDELGDRIPGETFVYSDEDVEELYERDEDEDEDDDVADEWGLVNDDLDDGFDDEDENENDIL